VKREWRGEEELVTVAVLVEEAGQHLLVADPAGGKNLAAASGSCCMRMARRGEARQADGWSASHALR
jgi:hypothetical protein